MNKKIFIIILANLLIVSLVSGYSISKKVEKEQQIPSNPYLFVDTNNLQYELIMNAFHFDNKIFKPNAALLILKKEEIKVDAKMFLSGTGRYHMCGYHYRFLFWTNADSLLGTRYINAHCDVEMSAFGYEPEETCIKLAYYIEQLETKPTHYIYSLDVPVSMEPNEIREKLKESELKLFFIDGEHTRFPSIYFSYYSALFVEGNEKNKDWVKAKKENEEIAKKKIKELVEKAKSISSIIEESDIYAGASGGFQDSVYRNDEIILRFEKGTDLSKVVKLLKKEGAKVVEQKNPKTYRVQVVDTSDNINSIKNKLNQYKFIKKITEYTRSK